MVDVGVEVLDGHFWWPDFEMPERVTNLFFVMLEAAIVQYFDLMQIEFVMHVQARVEEDFYERNSQARQFMNN